MCELRRDDGSVVAVRDSGVPVGAGHKDIGLTGALKTVSNSTNMDLVLLEELGTKTDRLAIKHSDGSMTWAVLTVTSPESQKSGGRDLVEVFDELSI